jgi:hypothetical protein
MDNLFSDNEKVTRENNVMLKSRFTDEETKEVVFGTYYAYGATGLDGFSFMLYTTY